MAMRAFLSAGAACWARREPGRAWRKSHLNCGKPAKIATALRRYAVVRPRRATYIRDVYMRRYATPPTDLPTLYIPYIK
jgi:hypothetical protein